VLEKRLDAAGFQRAALETIQGPTKPTKTQAGSGGWSTVTRVRSAAAAAAQIQYLKGRALAPCLTACEVNRKSFDLSDIPGAAGVERYQTENTSHGPAFEANFVFFSSGPYV
jgi:poly(3-hydroxybutyrate) depolymerase